MEAVEEAGLDSGAGVASVARGTMKTGTGSEGVEAREAVALLEITRDAGGVEASTETEAQISVPRKGAGAAQEEGPKLHLFQLQT